MYISAVSQYKRLSTPITHFSSTCTEADNVSVLGMCSLATLTIYLFFLGKIAQDKNTAFQQCPKYIHQYT